MTEQFGKFSPEVGIGLGRSEIIDRLYATAVDPERFGELVEAWEKCIGPYRALPLSDGTMRFHDPEIEAHFDRATIILDRLPPDAADAAQDVLKKFATMAACTIDRTLKIRATNAAARKVFGLQSGAGLDAFNLDDFDRARLARAVAAMQSKSAGEMKLLRFRSDDGRIMVFQIRGFVAANGSSFALVVTSELGWPDRLDAMLKSAFGLSNAEVLVLRGLVECQTAKAIAEARNRSLDTIRSQIQSILTKTETHSQTELVRIILSLMDVISSTAPRSPRAASLDEGHGGLERRPLVAVTCDDGREVKHLVLGDPNGTPVMFLPVRVGIVRWPAAAERAAARMGLKIIVPNRAGFGGSDPIPDGIDYMERTVADHIAVLDHHRVDKCPVIAVNTDTALAFSLAGLHPDRVSGIIACSGVLPYSSANQYARMDKWYRFLTANAKFAPQVVPFMAKAGFYMAKRRGKEAFFKMVYENCPEDLAVISQPEIREAFLAGSDIAFGDIETAHRAYASEAIMHAQYDWHRHVLACKGKLPVHFLNGLRDNTVPPETLADFQAEYDWINYSIYPECGQMVLFQHWQDVLNIAQACSH